MKKNILLLLLAGVVVSTSACTQETVPQSTVTTSKEESKEVEKANGSKTLYISEINSNGFVCHSIYPLPDVYIVKCNPDDYDEFCVGDQIEVEYKSMSYTDTDIIITPVSINISPSDNDDNGFLNDDLICYKPVIYLYPEEKTDAFVSLDYNGELTVTYPEYNNGWNVTAMPDGRLYDADGNEYSYLFWEGEGDVQYDFSKGFCVKGSDTAEFLRSALSALGLTPREYNEFIVFWLPFMQDNKYNVISFQGACYTENAALTVTPEPDTVLRVFMAFYGSDEFVEIPEQTLPLTERNGFTVVEWGGSKVDFGNNGRKTE